MGDMQTYQVSKTNYKISDFLAWAKAGTLVLSPSFQRRAVWPAGAKSYLMDTIARGLPVPIIFLREQNTDLISLEPKREVVDGQQRIRTVLSYILPKALQDYEPSRDDFTIKKTHNKDLASLIFKELPETVRQQILDYQFSVHILPSNVDDREVLQIFARMNATGLKLNPQELRNAAYFGEFKTSMYDLGAEQLPRWRNWRIFSEAQISRMQEVELTSELAQLMLVGVVGKTQAALDRLYNDHDDEWSMRPEAEKRFRHLMSEIDNAIGHEIGNTVFKSRSAFYGLYGALYDGLYGIKSDLSKVKAQPLPSDIRARMLKLSDKLKDKKVPENVLDALARRTTHPESRQVVIKYFKDQLIG